MVGERFLGQRTTYLKIISTINQTFKNHAKYCIWMHLFFMTTYFDILMGILLTTALACKPAVDMALCVSVHFFILNLLGHKI